MYPIDVSAEYGSGERSRGLALAGALFFLKALLLLPHLIIVGALQWVTGIVAYIGYWIILITGELPDFFHTFPLRTLQWSVRTTGWLVSCTDGYPPFEWEPPSSPVSLDSTTVPGTRNRVIALTGVVFGIKAVALVPHYIVLFFVWLAAAIAVWVGYIVVLFTGRLPRGIFEFAVGTLRWSNRVSAWLFSLTDEYPPFRMTA